jgi:hypothetical protein
MEVRLLCSLCSVGSDLYDKLITLSEESYWVYVSNCVWSISLKNETAWVRGRLLHPPPPPTPPKYYKCYTSDANKVYNLQNLLIFGPNDVTIPMGAKLIVKKRTAVTAHTA